MALSATSSHLPAEGVPIRRVSTAATATEKRITCRQVHFEVKMASKLNTMMPFRVQAGFTRICQVTPSTFWGCRLERIIRAAQRGSVEDKQVRKRYGVASLSQFYQKENEEGRVLEAMAGEVDFVAREGLRQEDLDRELNLPPLKTETDVLLAHYIPVYVMLPLDVVNKDNIFANAELLSINLRALKAAHVDGLMVDIWWGVVEAAGPKQYDWSGYQALFRTVKEHGLKLQVVMSFHQCGGNVGDGCTIPLPSWIHKIGESNPDIFFTNREGVRNREYLSFGVDMEPVFEGRTAVQMYADFMRSFRENMAEFLESGFITEIEVGLGPAGELRFPSYPETQGWRFPGIGEFQCYDNYMLGSLRDTASSIGQTTWGNSGPHDAGRYNDWPQSTGFFGNQGSYATDYGRFFLAWYSDVLLQHGDRVLEAATDAFAGCTLKVAAKVAGIHWWYNSRNHAAELAAGYYNLRERDGYRPLAKMLSRHRAVLNFTCIEMKDTEQYWEARCGPEGLVSQVLNAGWSQGIEVACENALPRYDRGAFEQILGNARPHGINKECPPKQRIAGFTFLRLCQDLMVEGNWREFNRFVRKMHAGLDYHPEPERFFRPREPLRHSKPLLALPQKETSPVPVASVPLDLNHLPIAPKNQVEPFFTKDAPGGGLGMNVEEFSADMARKVGVSDPTLGFMHADVQGQLLMNGNGECKHIDVSEEHLKTGSSNGAAGVIN